MLKLRRAVRARGHFPTDEAPMKLLYLVLNRAEKEWTMPAREWCMAKAQFAVLIGERFTKAWPDHVHRPPAHEIPGSPHYSRPGTRSRAAFLVPCGGHDSVPRSLIRIGKCLRLEAPEASEHSPGPVVSAIASSTLGHARHEAQPGPKLSPRLSTQRRRPAESILNVACGAIGNPRAFSLETSVELRARS